jgi:hypothetical protein
MKVTQALLSVSDKRGAVDFARGLAQLGVKLLSTGGTAKLLRDAGLEVTDVSDYTGFPEMLDGRVKTLHPKVHGGILGRRDLPEHQAVMAQHGIPAIDLVVVNLYPFRETVAKPGCTLDDAIENIDIGGPTMVRAAAKNHGNEQGGVGVITDPEDYAPVLEELKAGGALSYKTRFALAKKAFTHTARYDSAIANWLTALDEENKPGVFPDACNSPSTRSRPCATARTRTSRPPSIARPVPCRAASPATSRSRARNCPTTTSPTPMRPGSASRPSMPRSRPRPASSSSTPTPAAWPSAQRAGRPIEGLQDRSDLGLRRHHRLQRGHRQGDRRSRRRPVRRSDHRPRDHRRGARRVRRQAEPARAGRPHAGKCGKLAGAASSTTSASAAACWCRAPTMPASPRPTSRW